MKKIILILLCFSFCSCFFNNYENTTEDPVFSRYEAVTLTTSEFENSIIIQDKTSVTEASKIYIINNYIFINDRRTGFHIFDNTNSADPVKKKFLKKALSKMALIILVSF